MAQNTTVDSLTHCIASEFAPERKQSFCETEQRLTRKQKVLFTNTYVSSSNDAAVQGQQICLLDKRSCFTWSLRCDSPESPAVISVKSICPVRDSTSSYKLDLTFSYLLFQNILS